MDKKSVAEMWQEDYEAVNAVIAEEDDEQDEYVDVMFV